MQLAGNAANPAFSGVFCYASCYAGFYAGCLLHACITNAIKTIDIAWLPASQNASTCSRTYCHFYYCHHCHRKCAPSAIWC